MAPRWRSNLRELLFGAPADVEADEGRVANDLERSFYNYRLVKHCAEEDLVANPGFLWSSNAYWKARGGLGQHVLKEAELLDGAAYTDALVILSEADWRKTRARVVTPWDDSARELLAEKYDLLAAKNRLEPLMPQRGFQVRFLRDGDTTLDGERFDLEEGEFLTALIPHLYHGPVASSRLLAEIFVRMPEWEGEARKVGSLYNDQLGFTIGNHWLDSYQDRQLAEPALYLVHHYPDTLRLEHRLNIDQDGRYQLGAPTTGPLGEELQPLIRRADKKIVLEVMLVRPPPPVTVEPELEAVVEPPEVEAPAVEAPSVAASAVEPPSLASAAVEPHPLVAPAVEPPSLASAVEPPSLAAPAVEPHPLAPAALEPPPLPAPVQDPAVAAFRGAVTQLRPPPIRLEALTPIESDALLPLDAHAPAVDYPAAPGATTRVVTPATRVAHPGSTLPGESPTGTRLSLGLDPSLAERTVIPDRADDKALQLVDRGVLLQKIHFPQLMAGYTVSLGATGHIGLSVQRPFARIRVEHDRVWLEALQPGAFLNGERLEVHRPQEISLGAHRIAFGSTAFDYRALRRPSIPDWPYLAELRRPPVTRLLPAGERHRIGRNRKACTVLLPDRADQSNILWQSHVDAGGSVAAAGGVIPRDRVYTDSIMVAGEHAELMIDAGSPSLTNLSEHCQVFIRRSTSEIITLQPGKGAGAARNAASRLRSGDEILLGNSLFRVVFAESSSPVSDRGARDRGERGPGRVALSPASAPERESMASSPTIRVERREKLRPVGADVIHSGKPQRIPPAAARDAGPISAGSDDVVGPRPDADPARNIEVSPRPDADPARNIEVSPRPNADPARNIEVSTRPNADPARNIEVSTRPNADPARNIEVSTRPNADPARNIEVSTRPDVVVVRDEAAWSMDLRRPGRLVQIGWAIAGQATAGNHAGADLIIPENRVDRTQTFTTQDYFTAFVRGDRARITRVPGRDVVFKRREQMLEVAEDLEHLFIHVARRDPRDHVDFTVTLSFPADAPTLPRPRARLLAISLDGLNSGLFAWGLSAGESRSLRLGDIPFQARWTDEGARMEGYLEAYRLPDGSYRELYYTAGPVPAAPVEQTPGGQASGGQVSGGHVSSGQVSGGHVSSGPATGGHVSSGPATGGQVSGGPATGGPRSRSTPTWRTAPENGAALTLSPGSLLVVGNLVFRVES